MKLNGLVKAGVSVALATTLCGCATIFSHSQWPVAVNSNPSGAEVCITDRLGNQVQKGTTPVTVTLSAKGGYFSPAGYDLEVKMNGYTTARGHLEAQMNGWYMGNLLIGGAIGMLVVDPLSGAMWKLPPKYTINLDRPAITGDSVHKLDVVGLSSIPLELRSELVPLPSDGCKPKSPDRSNLHLE